jgi:pimeloyl-ACP methyl ester carboxylesterase
MAWLTSPDGIRLHYSIEGVGVPLLLHIGAGGDSDLWRAAGYVEQLAGNHLCVLFDPRGHGASDRPRGPGANDIECYERDVVALLDHLEIQAATFWGYSAGIPVGLRVAERHPERLTSLIGTGVIGNPSPEELAQMVARQVEESREHGWDAMITRFDVQERDPVPDWMKSSLRATDVQQYIDSLLARADGGWSAWQALPKVACPTLFLVGELEDPENRMAEAAALVPNGIRHRVSGQGHINAFIRSDLVLPLVTEFLSTHAA